MTSLPSPHARTHLEAAADGPLSEQVALPMASSLSRLSTLWIPPDALAQTWGQVGAEATDASLFLACALVFQGLASEASALSSYQQGQHTRGRARHLLHTARDLVEACRSWDGVVGWLVSRPSQQLPLSQAVRASLLTGAREQVARLWLLQSQVQTELVQCCLQLGLPGPCSRRARYVPSSLSATPLPEEGLAEPPDLVPAEEDAAEAAQQEPVGAPPTTAFAYAPSASTGRILS